MLLYKEELFDKYVMPMGEFLKFKIEEYNAEAVIPYPRDWENEIKIDSLPKALTEKLYNFQMESVRFAHRVHGRLLIADEMGVGKTV